MPCTENPPARSSLIYRAARPAACVLAARVVRGRGLWWGPLGPPCAVRGGHVPLHEREQITKFQPRCLGASPQPGGVLWIPSGLPLRVARAVSTCQVAASLPPHSSLK